MALPDHQAQQEWTEAEQRVALTSGANFSLKHAWPMWILLAFFCASVLCQLGLIGRDWITLFDSNLSISSAHWLGTNSLGQDLHAHLLQALASMLVNVLPGALIGFACGLALGLLAGFYADRWVDRGVLLLIDIFEALPVLIVLLLLAALLKESTFAMPLIFAMLFWSNAARTIRAASISAMCLSCMDSARLLGLNSLRIIVAHLLPIVRPLSIALALVVLGNCLRVQMVLGFLGLDPHATPNLGSLLNIATDDALGGHWWPLLLVLGVSALLLISIEFLARREFVRSD